MKRITVVSPGMHGKGLLQTLPLSLGEQGRNRRLVRVLADPHESGRPYTSLPGGGTILLHHGAYLVVFTRYAYHRGETGWSHPVHGGPVAVASGQWAAGAAGRIGEGTDTLYCSRAPSLFLVKIQGRGTFWCLWAPEQTPPEEGAILLNADEAVRLAAMDPGWKGSLLREAARSTPETPEYFKKLPTHMAFLKKTMWDNLIEASMMFEG